MKRVFLIHGYKSSPSCCWLPWLKKELIKRGFKVMVPRLPNPDKPTRKGWVLAIKKAVVKPDANTYFVGHSLGVPAILRYIETPSNREKIGGIISVGGRIIGKPGKRKQTYQFYKGGFKWDKIKKIVKKSIGVYSLDDPFVPIENGRLFKSKLNAKLIFEKNKGHFSGRDKVFKLPVVLRELLSIVR